MIDFEQLKADVCDAKYANKLVGAYLERVEMRLENIEREDKDSYGGKMLIEGLEEINKLL